MRFGLIACCRQGAEREFGGHAPYRVEGATNSRRVLLSGVCHTFVLPAVWAVLDPNWTQVRTDGAGEIVRLGDPRLMRASEFHESPPTRVHIAGAQPAVLAAVERGRIDASVTITLLLGLCSALPPSTETRTLLERKKRSVIVVMADSALEVAANDLLSDVRGLVATSRCSLSVTTPGGQSSIRSSQPSERYCSSVTGGAS